MHEIQTDIWKFYKLLQYICDLVILITYIEVYFAIISAKNNNKIFMIKM